MKKSTRDMILGSLFLALGIIVPYVFHMSGISGPVFLPMHLPVIIGAFFLSPGTAVVIGFLTPLLSSVISGMPVLYPIGVVMAFELMVYGLAASTLRRKLDVYYTLVFTMILGRLAAAGAVYSLQTLFGLKMNYLIYIKGAVVTGLPGIVIQLILVPVIVRALKKTLRR